MHYYLLIVSIPLWWMAVWLFYKQIAFLFRSKVTEGRLSDWRESKARYKSYWYPIVSFDAADGNTYQAVGNSGYGRKEPPYEVGRAFRVRYNPADPKEAQVSSILHYWAAPLAFFVLALGATVGFLQRV